MKQTKTKTMRLTVDAIKNLKSVSEQTGITASKIASRLLESVTPKMAREMDFKESK